MSTACTSCAPTPPRLPTVRRAAVSPPFLFKGINFSLGGYDAEYGQALSSVLPMVTTDASTSDKFGVSASLNDWNIGGTKATRAGSWSMNAAYTDMGLYNRLFPDRWTWHEPYRQLSGETQWKMQPTATSVWNTYHGFDRTTLSLDTYGQGRPELVCRSGRKPGVGEHRRGHGRGRPLSSPHG